MSKVIDPSPGEVRRAVKSAQVEAAEAALTDAQGVAAWWEGYRHARDGFEVQAEAGPEWSAGYAVGAEAQALTGEAGRLVRLHDQLDATCGRFARAGD